MRTLTNLLIVSLVLLSFGDTLLADRAPQVDFNTFSYHVIPDTDGDGLDDVTELLCSPLDFEIPYDWHSYITGRCSVDGTVSCAIETYFCVIPVDCPPSISEQICPQPIPDLDNEVIEIE